MMLKKNPMFELVNVLLRNASFLTIKELSEKLNVSEKTVWNRLHSDKLKDMLGDEVQLIKKTNAGIMLDGSSKALEELKHKVQCFTFEECEDDEFRRNKIIMLLLMNRESISMQDLCEYYLVSKKVIQLDLEMIQNKLNAYQLKLERKQNVGIRISGDEINIRQLFESVILQQTVYYKQDHHVNIVFDEGVATVLEDIGLHLHLHNAIEVVKNVQQQLVGSFTDEGKKEIILQILISFYRSEHGFLIEHIQDDLFETNTHFKAFLQLFERAHLRMKKNDYLYLWRRCINNRFTSGKEQEIDEKFLHLSKELLQSVMELQDSEEIEYLIQNLAFHIFQAVKRSTMGIRVHNPILQKIKQKYGKFYSMVLTNVNKFETAYHISLNEDEIGFITIYICAIYEKNISNHYYKVLLVSNEGVGQTQLLAMQIVNNFPNLLIHDTCNSLNIREEWLKDCDFIISTCPLMLKKEEEDKYIRISNFIDQKDLQTISARLLTYGGKQFQKKISIDNSDDIDFKYFACDLSSREEIFHTYLQIAEQFGYCDDVYMQSVIERENRASTSIGKGIAIPHGDDSHILHPAVFVVRNEHPVTWGEDEADIVLFLILKFNSIAENKQFFIRLYSCMEKTELIRDIDDTKKLKQLKEYIMGGNEVYE